MDTNYYLIKKVDEPSEDSAGRNFMEVKGASYDTNKEPDCKWTISGDTLVDTGSILRHKNCRYVELSSIGDILFVRGFKDLGDPKEHPIKKMKPDIPGKRAIYWNY